MYIHLYTYMYLCMHVKLLHSCPTLCNPMECSLPGSFVHGISQARRLEWVAISSSRGIFPTQESSPRLLWLLHCRQILYWWATTEALCVCVCVCAHTYMHIYIQMYKIILCKCVKLTILQFWVVSLGLPWTASGISVSNQGWTPDHSNESTEIPGLPGNSLFFNF